jgi:PIN domain nuclease of toxin-antitoxin system
MPHADASNDVVVSVASAWEIAVKAGLGKWPEAYELLLEFETFVDLAGFELLPIAVPHARQAGLLLSVHRDPFDRLLVAQAMAEGMTLVTTDAKITGMGCQVLW